MGNLVKTQAEVARYFCRSTRAVRDWGQAGCPVSGEGLFFDTILIVEWLQNHKPRIWPAICRDMDRNVTGAGGVVVGNVPDGVFRLDAIDVAELCGVVLDPAEQIIDDRHARGMLSRWFPGIRFFPNATNTIDTFQDLEDK